MTDDRNQEERALQRAVERLCDELGLLWHHCGRPVTCSGRDGLPDLIAAGPGGLVIPELKSQDGITTAGQDLWGWTLTRAWSRMGAASHPSGWAVWRPDDLESGLIRSQLERIAI